MSAPPREDALRALVAPLAPLAEGHREAWAVGGGVRDALLDRPFADLDVAVEGDAAPAASALARAAGANRCRAARWRRTSSGAT